MIKDIYNLMTLLEKEQVSLCFTGPFSQKLLVTIVDSIKVSISDEKNMQTLINKIFSAVVEMTQNIIEYETPVTSPKSQLLFENGIVLVGKSEKAGYYVLSVNAIETSIKDDIVRYVEEVNKMDKAELRKSYLKKIREGSDTKKDRGGVGLLMIARNATTLSCEVLKENEDYSYLFVKATFE